MWTSQTETPIPEDKEGGYHITIHLTQHVDEKMHIPTDVTFDELLKLLAKKRHLDLTKYKFAPAKSLGLFKSLVMTYRLSWLKTDVVELHLVPYLSDISVTKVFGQPLDYIVTNNNGLPPFFEICCDFVDKYGIEEEGVFRKAGTLNTINEYRRQLDLGSFRPFPPNEDVNVPACIIKAWLRELPTAIIPIDKTIEFKQILTQKQLNDQLLTMREFLNALPKKNYAILQHLCALLHKIAKNEKLNRMNPDNLAIVLAPNIIKFEQSGLDFIRDSPQICKLFGLFVSHYEKLFKQTSPYDATLKGYLDLKVDPLQKDENMYGHVMRNVYEVSALTKTYQIASVRLTGESLLCLNEKDKLDKEIPYDHITNLTLEKETIKVEFKKSHILIQGPNLKTWKDEYTKVSSQYTKFKTFVQHNPKEFGSIITKEEKTPPLPSIKDKVTPPSTPDTTNWKKLYEDLKIKYEIEVQARIDLEMQIQQLQSQYLAPDTPIENPFDSDSDDSVDFTY